MTFARKLTAVILLLLCLTLSAGGAWTVQQNFAALRTAAEQQAAAQHLRDCFAIETAIEEAGAADAAALQGIGGRYRAGQRAAAGESGAWFAVLGAGGTVYYSDMPGRVRFADQWAAVQDGAASLRYAAGDGAYYLLLASPLSGGGQGLWLVTAADVTASFAERDRQLVRHFVLTAAALVLAGGAAALLAQLLTRPLRRLETVSRAIAGGAYGSRAEVVSDDEVGRLGQAFNTMADAVEHQVEALQQESARQKRFVAAFTHELKTPMTAMLGYADLLRRAEQPPEKRRRAADYIYRESQRLERLSRELLLLLGLEEGGVPLAAVPLPPLLEEVRRSQPQGAPRLDIRCPAHAAVQADAPLLGMRVDNLGRNACAAKPADGMVHISCLPQDGGWLLTVADRGCGIPPHALDKVTEPFYMADNSRARAGGGSGLGLSWGDAIAQAHGTALHIESEPGRGTAVRLWLKGADLE